MGGLRADPEPITHKHAKNHEAGDRVGSSKTTGGVTFN
jgi:hypothetical protein